MPRYHFVHLLFALAAVVVGQGISLGASIDIDGYDNDWTGLPAFYDGPDLSADQYDIDYNWSHWGINADTGRHNWLFMVQSIDPFSGEYPTPPSPKLSLLDKIDILVDLRPGGGTRSGVSGVDLYIAYNFPDLSFQHVQRQDVPVYYFTPGGTLGFLGSFGWGAWGNLGDYWVAEFALDPTHPSIVQEFGSNIGHLDWVAYLGCGLGCDDWCPGEGWNRLNIPEPGTAGLFGLGVLGVIGLRLRRRFRA